MSTSMLEQLLSEAQAAQEPKDMEQQMAEIQQKSFEVSKVYREHAQDLEELVEPLRSLLPTVEEYESYAAPHDGLAAGPQWDSALHMDPARKRLRLENPGLLVITKCNRTEKDGVPYPELSDDEYTAYLDSVELMANWWEKKSFADTLQLAKSIIVHTVLENPVLCSMTLYAASENVKHLMEVNAELGSWRDKS